MNSNTKSSEISHTQTHSCRGHFHLWRLFSVDVNSDEHAQIAINSRNKKSPVEIDDLQ